MPMRPFTENYDDYLQSSEDEFADLENRSFTEQQLIRSAAERDPRQYRGIGYGGLTNEEKETVAAAGMELPQNLVARENIQQKYRRAAAPKGFGFDEKDTPSIAEKAIEAEKVGQSGEGSGDGKGPADIEGLTGTMDMATAKRMVKTLAPYAAQLGISGFLGMPATMMAGMLAKRFGLKFGVKALKGLYGQVTGGGGGREPETGAYMTKDPETGIVTRDVSPGFEISPDLSIEQQEELASKLTQSSVGFSGGGPIGPRGFEGPGERGESAYGEGPASPSGFGGGGLGTGWGADAYGGGAEGSYGTSGLG